MGAGGAFLAAVDMEQALGEIGLIPAQGAQFGNPQAVAVGKQDGGRVPVAVAVPVAGDLHQFGHLGGREVFAAPALPVGEAARRTDFPIFKYRRGRHNGRLGLAGSGPGPRHSPIYNYKWESPGRIGKAGGLCSTVAREGRVAKADYFLLIKPAAMSRILYAYQKDNGCAHPCCTDLFQFFEIMNIYQLFSCYIRVFLSVLFLAVLPGCMTVSDKQTIVENNAAYNFAGRRVAILPVKAQTSLAPDSVLALRNEINKRLGQAVRGKLTSSNVLDMPTAADLLNQHDALSVLEQLSTTYENTGIIDKRHTNALGTALESDYLVFSRLKAEKMDLFILGKGMAASLETMILDAKTGRIAWSGSGEWKRGGIFGLGGATADEAATQLVTLSLSSLQQATASASGLATTASMPVEEPEKPVSTTKKTKKKQRK